MLNFWDPFNYLIHMHHLSFKKLFPCCVISVLWLYYGCKLNCCLFPDLYEMNNSVSSTALCIWAK